MNEQRPALTDCDSCEYRGVPVEFEKGKPPVYCARTAMDNSVVLLRAAQGKDVSMFPGPDEPVARLPIAAVSESVAEAYYDVAVACAESMETTGVPVDPSS